MTEPQLKELARELKQILTEVRSRDSRVAKILCHTIGGLIDPREGAQAALDVLGGKESNVEIRIKQLEEATAEVRSWIE